MTDDRIDAQAAETAAETKTEHYATAPRRHTKSRQGMVFKIRQVLNALFMLLAVAGGVMYCGLLGEGVVEQMGVILIVIAVCIKMSECVLRIKR